MPSARNYNRPVFVEVRPEDVAPKSNIAPSSPTSSPTKAVRFPVQEIVAGVSRPLTQTEAWSLYHFEKHARSCRHCRSPYETILNGGRLCEVGHDLAYDVAMHVYHRNGQIYSNQREAGRDIRVEVPHGYDTLLALLKAMDRRQRKTQRTAPIISYDTRKLPQTYASAPAVQEVEPEDYSNAYINMHRTNSHSPRRRHTTTKRYSTIVRGDDDEYERPRSSSKEEKRGSLYRDEPRRTEYRVEVREPTERRRRDRDGRYHV